MYNQQVTDIEQGTFTPLIFTTTGGMGEECEKYHSRLAELIATKEGRTTLEDNFMDKSENIIFYN